MVMEKEVLMSLQLRVYLLPGGRIPKIAVAETCPSSFRAMHLYVPESVWLASSICSQLESSYFWGPPRDYRKNGEMERLRWIPKYSAFPVLAREGDPYITFVFLDKFIKAYNQERPKCPKSWSHKHLQLDISIPIKLLALFTFSTLVLWEKLSILIIK